MNAMPPSLVAAIRRAKLTAPDGHEGDNFGISAALSGATAVVGSYRDDTAGGTDAGSAYVFVRSGATWAPQARLTASDGEDFDGFGISVAVSGDTAVVGAYRDDALAGADVGSAYMFVRSGTTWAEQVKLTAGDGEAGDSFGVSVAVDRDTGPSWGPI